MLFFGVVGYGSLHIQRCVLGGLGTCARFARMRVSRTNCEWIVIGSDELNLISMSAETEESTTTWLYRTCSMKELRDGTLHAVRMAQINNFV